MYRYSGTGHSHTRRSLKTNDRNKKQTNIRAIMCTLVF